MSGGSARREEALRLGGSVGANRVMERELLRLVKRSPFEVRVPKPRREGSATLRYPFSPEVAWVAACYHRTCSSISWELCSSAAVRLEPLHAEVVAALADDERLDLAGESFRFSVEVRDVADFEAGPLQVRGVVKNAVIEGAARRRVTAVLEPDEPELVFTVRRAGPEEDRRTWVTLDLGGGGRHQRGARAAVVEAPLRETLAAQLVAFSGWDARSEVLVDPLAGSGTIPIEAARVAVGAAVRQPAELRLGRLATFSAFPDAAPDLFPGTRPRILATDSDDRAVPAMIGNLRRAHLTGPAHEGRIVTRQLVLADLTPGRVRALFPGLPRDAVGVFCTNPPYGQRLKPAAGEAGLDALYAEMGRTFRAFEGWRAAVFVANEGFKAAFGGRPDSTKPASNAKLRGAFHLYRL